MREVSLSPRIAVVLAVWPTHVYTHRGLRLGTLGVGHPGWAAMKISALYMHINIHVYIYII